MLGMRQCSLQWLLGMLTYPHPQHDQAASQANCNSCCETEIGGVPEKQCAAFGCGSLRERYRQLRPSVLELILAKDRLNGWADSESGSTQPWGTGALRQRFESLSLAHLLPSSWQGHALCQFLCQFLFPRDA